MFKEGCLSAPGKYVMVERSQKVVCQYTDENGEQKRNERGNLNVHLCSYPRRSFSQDPYLLLLY